MLRPSPRTLGSRRCSSAEAQLAAQIHHPHVCEILDLGEQDGVLFIVMEWIDGEPLSVLQKSAKASGGVPAPIATRVVLNAAQGLHAAHELRGEDGRAVGLGPPRRLAAKHPRHERRPW